jgi:hypothetical protein
MSGEDKSLLERVEVPSIPRETAIKIAHLQEQFIRAEVEQRKLPFLCFTCVNEITITIPLFHDARWRHTQPT